MPNKLKDEDYWWDILKSVISFSITGLLAYLTAVILGYVRTPGGRETALYVSVTVVPTAILFGMWAILHRMEGRPTRANRILFGALFWTASVLTAIGIWRYT